MSNADICASTAISVYLSQVLGEATPWLVVIVAVVFCDLVFGLRRAWTMGEEIRFSKACRDTMGKTITYVAFVLMVCAIDTATAKGWRLEMWSCLFVCLIEGSSIISNLLKPKGITINLAGLLNQLFSKITKTNNTGEVFKKDDGANTNKKV